MSVQLIQPYHDYTLLGLQGWIREKFRKNEIRYLIWFGGDYREGYKKISAITGVKPDYLGHLGAPSTFEIDDRNGLTYFDTLEGVNKAIQEIRNAEQGGKISKSVFDSIDKFERSMIGLEG